MRNKLDDSFVYRGGRAYQLVIVFHNPVGFETKLLLGTLEIGRASVGLDTPKRATLYDINIYSAKGMQHRSLGLGAAMLHKAMAQARSLGASEMYGAVIKTDLEAKPDLLEWYALQGFETLRELDPMGRIQVFTKL